MKSTRILAPRPLLHPADAGLTQGNGAADGPPPQPTPFVTPVAMRARPADAELRAPAKYQLIRPLGCGGMGTVYLARDRNLGRLVALKFLCGRSPDFVRRFRREARVMARLADPAIVRVHEFDVHEGRFYIAMDYLGGGNLAAKRLEPLQLVRAVRPVVRALQHAHAEGVVHRDIKPENILLDDRGRAYLSDFGLASVSKKSSDTTGRRPILGTPLTMSPEQAMGEAVIGPASDVFSLGVTLYQKLTGDWPFRGRNVADVLYAIVHEPERSPRELDRRIPRSLSAIVSRCLAKAPEDRFESMQEVGRALDRLILRQGAIERVAAFLRLWMGHEHRNRRGLA